jgi:KDO2-lipid IV(A) lauroyltransferase
MRPRSALERLAHRLEAALVMGVFALTRLMPVEAASWVGGWLARCIGPLLPVSRVGRDNLRHAFPEKSASEIERILRGVWENLGRTAAEYPHLQGIWDYDPGIEDRNARVVFEGLEHLVERYRDDQPAILFSAHLGNWELLPIGAARHGLPMVVMFRAPSNPFVAQLVDRVRGAAMGLFVAKRVEGAAAAARLLEDGKWVGMLVDQRYGRGVRVPFFGRPAASATLLAKLVRRFGCPVHGIKVERLPRVRFRVTVSPPLELPRSDDPAADERLITTRVNEVLEGWIRERPEQWLWLHRRWRD